MRLHPRTIRLPEEIWQAVEEAAEANLRTVNNMVHVILEGYLWENDWYPARDGHPMPPYADETYGE